jgi:hypothetical protein
MSNHIGDKLVNLSGHRGTKAVIVGKPKDGRALVRITDCGGHRDLAIGQQFVTILCHWQEPDND